MLALHLWNTAEVDDIVMCFILVGVLAIRLCIIMYRHAAGYMDTIRLAKQRIDLLEQNKLNLWSICETRCRMVNSEGMVRCLRDGMWVVLPLNVLVKGDVVGIKWHCPAPCKLVPVGERVEQDKMIWGKGQIVDGVKEKLCFSRVFEEETVLCTVIDEPSIQFLQKIMKEQDCKRPATIFSVYFHSIRTFTIQFYFVCFGISIFFVLLRMIIETSNGNGASSYLWIFNTIKRHAILLLSGGFLAEPFLLLLADTLSHALTFASIDQVQEFMDNKYLIVTEETKETDQLLQEVNAEEDSSEKEQELYSKKYVDSPSLTLLKLSEISFTSVFKHCLSILNGKSRYRVFSTLPMISLGSTNYLCFTDKEGILTSGSITPEHVLLWEGADIPKIIETISSSHSNEDPDADSDLHRRMKNLFSFDAEVEARQKLLDKHLASYSFEGDWQDHFDGLKPLALASLLASHCYVGPNIPQSQWFVEDQFETKAEITPLAQHKHHHRAVLPLSAVMSEKRKKSMWLDAQTIPTCNCSIAKVVGFDITQTLLKYAIKKRINYKFLVPGRSNDSQSQATFEMTSVIVNANANAKKGGANYQLFTTGVERLVLARSSHYFDGKKGQIAELTSAERARIVQITSHWHREDLSCLAFSYAPLSSVKCNRLFHADPENDVIFLDNENLLPKSLLSGRHTVFSSMVSTRRATEARVVNAYGMRVAATDYMETLFAPFASPSDIISSSKSIPPVALPSPAASTSQTASTYAQYNSLLNRQIFLGLIAYRNQPKIELASFVEDVLQAGIRFAMLLPDSSSRLKAFAEKIGLDTDWNSCISLQDPDDKHHVLSPDENRSKLPQGVSTVRNHLKFIDDVPLLISLFSDCVSSTSEDMIRILQENGGIVCVVGSSLHFNHADVFSQADVCICLDPLPFSECSVLPARKAAKSDFYIPSPAYSACFEYAFASSMQSLSGFAPNMMAHSTLHQISCLIAQSRTVFKNYKQSLLFAWCCYISMLLLICFSNVLDLPLLFTGYQVLWICLVIVPVFSLSILFSKRSGHEMKQMPDKNEDHLKDKLIFLVYFAMRFIPHFAILVFLFLWFLHSAYDSNKIWATFYWNQINQGSAWSGLDSYNNIELNSLNSTDRLLDSHWFQTTLIICQNYAILFLVWIFTFLSMSFLHRFKSIRNYNPFKNVVWILACLVAWLLQTVFCLVSLYSISHTNYLQFYPPVGVIVIALCWPICCICIDETVKHHDAGRFAYYQRKLRLNFDTKLGMYSPK